jgi:hypothetical protein
MDEAAERFGKRLLVELRSPRASPVLTLSRRLATSRACTRDRPDPSARAGRILLTSVILLGLKIREDRKMDRWADRQRLYLACMEMALALPTTVTLRLGVG